MMKLGREGKVQAAPSADLLVCFPSRAHLTLMPKPICSPARPAEPNKRHHNSHHHRKKSFSRGGGQASPLLWTKTKSMGSEIMEPTSPKVTCAGQIKVRPKTTACRSWQSVMEEIEKIHTDKKQRKRLSWAESVGFKKEVMQFLTCLRSIRFDLRCFRSFSGTDIATEEDEDDDDEVEEEENHVGVEESDNEASRTVFSKWFMVLQEEQTNGVRREETEERRNDEETVSVSVSVPPPNALLLMRCRSAPAKSLARESGGDHHEQEGKEESAEREKEKEKEKDVLLGKKGQSLKSLMEEEKRKRENLVVMRYDSDFYDISSEVAKETWIVGGLSDLMSRSRSWKR
ncbi:phosphatase 1 regulatory subunit 15A [Spatholobus suberectus]|nr:phosphatase 1 regulatory subunit 15A [Spatholobus suberectus]